MPANLEKFYPFFSWLVQTSWQAAILVFIILFLQKIFRKFLPAAWSFALWFILLVRLLLPVAPSSPLSLFNYLDIEKLNWRTGAEKLSENSDSNPPIGVGVSALGEEKPQAAHAGGSPQFNFPFPLISAWGVGVIVLLLRTVYVNFALLSHAKKLRPLVDSAMLNLLEDCKNELRVYVPVSVVITDKVRSPALLGFVRPRLLLPKHMLEALTPAELRHVFSHELAHVKRLDIFCNWVITFLQILHWFNPILWFAFNRMRSDLEIACDSLVLSTPGKNQEYGQTVIKVLELTTKISPLPGTVGILEDKDYMKRRIHRIGETQAASRRWSVLGAALIAFLALIALTNPPPAQNHEVQDQAEILQRMKAAYERQDLQALMEMYADNAAYQEIGPDGAVYSSLNKNEIKRLEIFNNFIAWMKIAKPQEYASLFSQDQFAMHRAGGDKINRLFFEWVASKVNQSEERRMISMNDLPEVKQVRLDDDIIAICKEFRGPYADVRKYVTEVENFLKENKLAYRPFHVLGIYFDDPNQPHPENHRSIQGVMIEKEIDIEPPYFIYKMKRGDAYLYTKVKGSPAEADSRIPAGYMALFNYMGLKKIRAGSTGGHQIVTMEGDQIVFEIYLKIDE